MHKGALYMRVFVAVLALFAVGGLALIPISDNLAMRENQIRFDAESRAYLDQQDSVEIATR